MDRGNSPFPVTKTNCRHEHSLANVLCLKFVGGSRRTLKMSTRSQFPVWRQCVQGTGRGSCSGGNGDYCLVFTSAGKVLLPLAIGLPLRQTYHAAWGRHFGPPRDSRPTSPIYLP